MHRRIAKPADHSGAESQAKTSFSKRPAVLTSQSIAGFPQTPIHSAGSMLPRTSAAAPAADAVSAEEQDLPLLDAPISVQRQITGAAAGGAVPDATADAIVGSSGGQPLPPSIRAPMERALTHDFSQVRIHADERADTLSQQLSARAFTSDNQIFFRQGAYRPDSSAGRRLLAHELTHVVQQAGALRRGLVQRVIDPATADLSQVTAVEALGNLGGHSNVGIFRLTIGSGTQSETLIAKFTDDSEPASDAITFGDEVTVMVGLTGSKPQAIPHTQQRFKDICDAIKKFVTAGVSSSARNVILMRYLSGVDAGSQVRIQESDVKPTEREELLHKGAQSNFNPIAHFTNPAFINNLGRMLVVDTFLGHQDRFSIVPHKKQESGVHPVFNAVNFKIQSGSAEIGSFDQDVRLYSRQFFAKHEQGGNAEAWFNMLIYGEDMLASVGNRPVPSLGLIFTEQGQQSLYAEFSLGVTPNGKEDSAKLAEFRAALPFAQFQQHLQTGMVAAIQIIHDNATTIRQAAQRYQSDQETGRLAAYEQSGKRSQIGQPYRAGNSLSAEAVDVRLAFIESKARAAQGKAGPALAAALADNTAAEAVAWEVAFLSPSARIEPAPVLPEQPSTAKAFVQAFVPGGKGVKGLRTAINQGVEAATWTMDELDQKLQSIQGKSSQCANEVRFHLNLLKLVRDMQEKTGLAHRYLTMIDGIPPQTLQAQQATILGYIKNVQSSYTLISAKYIQQITHENTAQVKSQQDEPQRERLVTANNEFNLAIQSLREKIRAKIPA